MKCCSYCTHFHFLDEASTETMTCGTENKHSQHTVFSVNAQKVIFETHKCHWQQAAVFPVKQCQQMFVCVCSGSAVSVVRVEKEKQITSGDANSTRVIKAFIAVLYHSTVNRPSRPAAPAKRSSFLLSSSLSVVLINHKLNTQAEKQDCCTLWTRIHCSPCAPACGSNKFTLLKVPERSIKIFLCPENEIAWWKWRVYFLNQQPVFSSRFIPCECGLWDLPPI